MALLLNYIIQSYGSAFKLHNSNLFNGGFENKCDQSQLTLAHFLCSEYCIDMIYFSTAFEGTDNCITCDSTPEVGLASGSSWW